MDKIQRVEAALRGERVDRIPFSLFFHFLEEEYAGEAMARAHIEFYRAAGLDIMKVMNDNYYSPPGFTGLTRAADWRALRPAPISSTCFQNQLSGLRRIVEDVGDEVMVITTVFNPFHDCDAMSGWTASAQLDDDPEAVAEGLSSVAESLSNFVRACIEAGADGVYFAAHGGGRVRHSQDEFERFIKPHDLEVLRAARDAGGTLNLLHICGKDLRLAPYADYPADAVNWAPQSGNLTLSEGRRLFGKTVVGGLDQGGPILTGAREDVVREVRRTVEETGSRGLILGAGCALTRTVSPARVRWVGDELEAIASET